jgi:hypothetical protein
MLECETPSEPNPPNLNIDCSGAKAGVAGIAILSVTAFAAEVTGTAEVAAVAAAGADAAESEGAAVGADAAAGATAFFARAFLTGVVAVAATGADADADADADAPMFAVAAAGLSSATEIPGATRTRIARQYLFGISVILFIKKQISRRNFVLKALNVARNLSFR